MAKIWCAGLMFGVWASVLAGAQVESATSKLQTASALMSLDGLNEKPWHLKLGVTLIDESKVPNEGTIEVWHAGTDQRIVTAFGDATSMTLQHGGKAYYSSAGPSLPHDAWEVLSEFVHPGPEPTEIEGTVPELRKQKFGKSEFDCVMLSRPLKGSRPAPLGLYPTYCMSEGIIRLTYHSVDQAVVLNHIGTFLGRNVALEVAMQEGQVQVATAKVVTLATYAPAPNEFVPAANMRNSGETARVAGGVIAGNRVSFVEPVYPDSAKRDHREGTVVLHAIIERDGTVHRLRPMNAADPDLAIAAILAVRQWKYRPYLLNGEPTEVDTTITVNFALRGW